MLASFHLGKPWSETSELPLLLEECHALGFRPLRVDIGAEFQIVPPTHSSFSTGHLYWVTEGHLHIPLPPTLLTKQPNFNIRNLAKRSFVQMQYKTAE